MRKRYGPVFRSNDAIAGELFHVADRALVVARAQLRAPRAREEKARFRGVTLLPSRGGEAIVECV